MNRVLGTNTNKSNKNKNRLHEIKNGNTLCKTPNMRLPQTKSQLAKTSKNQQISQHPQKCGYYIPSKSTKSNRLAPYSRPKNSVTPENSPMQKEEKQPSLACPFLPFILM